MSASQSNRSAAPEKRVGKDRNSASRRSDGRARLWRGALGGGGVPGMLGCEPTDAATDSEGEGKRGVNGGSETGGDGGWLVSNGGGDV
jgi:hypothetical protein